MMNEALTEGVYEIPRGFKAAIRGGMIEIVKKRPKPRRPDDLRCVDCAHCGNGQTFYSQDSRFYGLVCFKRVKRRMISDGKVVGNLYYSVSDRHKICDQFRRKKRTEKDHSLDE